MSIVKDDDLTPSLTVKFGVSASIMDADSSQTQSNNGTNERTSRKLNERCVIEDFTKCSESHLWKLMMSFYDRHGVESWSHGIVPHFITCNTFIGRSYANLLCGFLRDCMSGKTEMKLCVDEPFYIVELGAGSGKFSFFMLKALLKMKDVCEFPLDKIVYVMTDFTENNFNFWAEHPALKPYVDSGQLEMAIFDAVRDDTITLSHSKLVISAKTLKNPMCIVANYLFDTLSHDIFQVHAGELKEGLISVGSTQPVEPDPLDPEIIQRFSNKFIYQNVNTDYYRSEANDSEIFEQILQWYKKRFGSTKEGASFLFPIGALRTLSRLLKFSGNRALVISGDKGNNRPEQFTGQHDPHIAVHGSFSVMVNYHIIGLFFTLQGGFSLHSNIEDASLKVSAFVSNSNFSENALKYEETLNSQGILFFEENADEISKGISKKLLNASRIIKTDENSEDMSNTEEISVESLPSENSSEELLKSENTEEIVTVDLISDGNAYEPSNGTVRLNTRNILEKNSKDLLQNYDIIMDSYGKATANSVQSFESLTDNSEKSVENMEEKLNFNALDSNRSKNFPSLIAAFGDHIENFGPNEFFMIQKGLKEDAPNPSLKLVMTLLKLSNWDSDIFYKFRDVILTEANRWGPNLENDVKNGVLQVWENYYLLDIEKDIAFEIGRFHYGIREYRSALKFYRYSTCHIGEHHITFHNMGLCFYSLGNFKIAIEYFIKSLDLNPDYEKAKLWLTRVEDESLRLRATSSQPALQA